MKLNNQGLITADIIITVAVLNLIVVLVAKEIFKTFRDVKVSTAKIQLAEIHKAVWLMSHDTNFWPGRLPVDFRRPSNFQGRVWNLGSANAGLVANDLQNLYPNWQGPYLSTVPQDPWGNDYFFDASYLVPVSGGKWQWRVVVGSFGPNGVSQSVDIYDQDDIIRVIR